MDNSLAIVTRGASPEDREAKRLAPVLVVYLENGKSEWLVVAEIASFGTDWFLEVDPSSIREDDKAADVPGSLLFGPSARERDEAKAARISIVSSAVDIRSGKGSIRLRSQRISGPALDE